MKSQPITSRNLPEEAPILFAEKEKMKNYLPALQNKKIFAYVLKTSKPVSIIFFSPQKLDTAHAKSFD